MNDYEIWDINRYVEYYLQIHIISDLKTFKDEFNKLSKGFNFIIAIYNNNDNDYRFFSVNYFNDKVIGND